MLASHIPQHTPVFTAFIAAVTVTAATFGISHAEARQSGNRFWVAYTSPTFNVTVHTEACSHRREAELRFERAVIGDLTYTPN